MRTLFPETTLPNGMKIFYLRKEEVPILYEQIQEYFKNGIELYEGDTVFDVGANIGLFALHVYQVCRKNVSIYAFEPIPAIFDVLQRNAERFDPENIKVFLCGLSTECKTTTFAYHPKATALSTAYPDGSNEVRDQLKRAILRNLKNAPPYLRRLRLLPPSLRSLILNHRLRRAFQIEQVTCQLRTVSDILRNHAVERIDLLKVDVEKSELDVLLGIEGQDWPKIKQVVVEVHDLEHRVKKIAALLKGHGFRKITLEQEPIFKDSNIFNLYALRQNSR